MAVPAEPEEAGTHFETALAGPNGTERPYERAYLHLEYGERLRWRKRMIEARTNFLLALDIFGGLAATPAVVRARAELHTCRRRIDETELPFRTHTVRASNRPPSCQRCHQSWNW